jgi:hypothetical protein
MPGVDLPAMREVGPARGFPELRDYRGIVDCRPRRSGLTQTRLADLAHDAQIDFICLADRASRGSSEYGIGGFTGELLVVPGASFAVARGGAEIVGLNLSQPIDPDASPAAIIGAIHRQNGVAIAVRPARFASASDYALADAMEVYNLERAWRSQNSGAIYMRALLFGATRFFSDLDTRPDEDLLRYDQMAAGARVALLAGLGGEENLSVMGVRVGTFEQLFQVCTTHILAPERQAEPLVDALRRGHVYVSFDILGYVADFAFYAENGSAKVMIGEEARLSPETRLKIELPAPADEVAIVRDGARITSAAGVSALEFQPGERGAYRVEAYRGGRLWILSNPIYLR